MKHRFKYILLFFAMLPMCAIANAMQHDVTGTWNGAIELPGMQLGISVHFEAGTDGSISGNIDIPQQGATGLNLVNISLDGTAIVFAIEGIPGDPVFKGELDGDVISGNFEQGGQAFPFSIEREASESPKEEAAKPTEDEFFEQLRELAGKAMDAWNIPGMAVGIVKDGELVFAEGYGYRNREDGLSVTPNTQFAIGSTTKAITALGVAMLVEDGLISWREPVISYLPDFRLYDEVATMRLNPIDLLTHRSGLPRHDFAWYGSDRSRQELYQALRHLENSRDIRTEFQYQNLMYMAAGILIESVSGKSWEDFSAERIFKPLGMGNSNFSVNDMAKAADFSHPYLYSDGEINRIPFRNIDAIGPAGSVNSSVNDMSKWLKFLLNKGKADGKTIVESSTIDFLFIPQITMRGESGHSQYAGYGLGWMIEFYRGKRHFHHGGGIDGFITQVGLLPDAKVGYVVLTNNSGNAAGTMLGNYILDFYYDLDAIDWAGRLMPKDSPADEETPELVDVTDEAEPDENRVKGTSPSFALKNYAGTYNNKGYGTLEIKYEDGTLKGYINSMEMELEHWHYDVFKTEVMAGTTIMLQFQMDMDGNITAVRVPVEASVSPIVFERQPDLRFVSHEYLQRFTGDYAIGPQISTFSISGDKLRLSITGQPPYMLEAIRENEFRLVGLDGFRVRFEFENGDKASKAVYLQPNGVFEAKRKE